MYLQCLFLITVGDVMQHINKHLSCLCPGKLKSTVTFRVWICMSMCVTSGGTDPTLYARPRIDGDLCLTPSKPFHNMQLAVWLILSSTTSNVNTERRYSPGHMDNIDLFCRLWDPNKWQGCRVLWVVCRFFLRSAFMIGGVYGWVVVLSSEGWCRRATAGRCPALLMFQLRFNTPRWSHQLPPKPGVINGHHLNQLELVHLCISEIYLGFFGWISGER